MATEEKVKSLRDKMNFQKKELVSKQRTLNTFNLVEGNPFEGRKVFECPKCKGKCFTSKSYLKAHCKRRHPEGIDEAPTLAKQTTLKTQTGLEKERLDSYSEQAEELKKMQRKLNTLISQATSSMNVAEGTKDEREAINTRQTLDELYDKCKKLQDQVHDIKQNQILQEDNLSKLNRSRLLESKVDSQYEPRVRDKEATTSKLSIVEEKENTSMYYERAGIIRTPEESKVDNSRQEELKAKPPVDRGRAAISTISERMGRSLDFRGEKSMYTKSLYIKFKV